MTTNSTQPKPVQTPDDASLETQATAPASALEPEWSSFRAFGHRMLDDMVSWLASIRERPPWQPVPEDVRARLRVGVPRAPQGLEATYADFQADVLPYPTGNFHPRFWGWVNGSGVPAAIYADFLASVMNANVGAFDQGAVFVEEQVLSWVKELIEYPGDAGALLTSGGSMANLLALGVARTAKAQGDVRKRGVACLERPMTVYGSSQTHYSVKKALEMLGLGSDAFRTVAIDGDFRIDLQALAEAVQADRENGFCPAIVIANAGTVNTGAVDDLDGIADLAQRENLWVHVDGAIGAIAWMCPELRPLLAGLQRADSIAFDLHKWLFLPNDVGCVLVRNRDVQLGAFGSNAEYLMNMDRGIASDTGHSYKDMGIELTRRFRALKVWFSLKAHGVEAFAETIRQNVLQARHLARLVDHQPRLELLNRPQLCIVVFRYLGRDLDAAVLDDLNSELLVRLQESGAAVPSHTRIDGRFALRVAITNHRTRLEDLDFLADGALRVGDLLLEEYRSEGAAVEWIRIDTLKRVRSANQPTEEL